MPGIDVLVTSYQYGRFLRDAMTSILKQRVDDLRVLSIENTSADNCAEVTRELAAGDSRVAVRIHSSNPGYTTSIKNGIEWAAPYKESGGCTEQT